MSYLITHHRESPLPTSHMSYPIARYMWGITSYVAYVIHYYTSQTATTTHKSYVVHYHILQGGTLATSHMLYPITHHREQP